MHIGHNTLYDSGEKSSTCGLVVYVHNNSGHDVLGKQQLLEVVGSEEKEEIPKF